MDNWMTSSLPAMMPSLSFCREATRMWRTNERANLEKNPSKAEPGAMLGRKRELEATGG